MLVTPRDIWLKILAVRFGARRPSSGPKRPGGPPPWLEGLAAFQAEGVLAALRSLERFGGALLCDSPGLGKTRMALAVAGELGLGGAVPFFVMPAALVEMWRREAGRARVSFRHASHESLGRRAAGETACGAALVVIDEAHAFRNGVTRSYARLAELCAGKRVLLVTATPVNNRLEDLYHQLRLFAGDATFAALGVADLREAVRPGAAREGLARVLGAVVVRRTREQLSANPGAARTGARRLAFPERSESEVAVDQGGAGRESFEKLVSLLEERAPRDPLLVFVLAKRLASSFEAFGRTLDRMRALRRLASSLGGAPADARLRQLIARDLDEEGGAQGLLFTEPDCAEDSPGSTATPEDTSWLDWLVEPGRRLRMAVDPKADALEAMLVGELREVKTVVFTEYRETAQMLFRRLKGLGRVSLLHGSGGRTAAGPNSRAEVLERFAPVASGRPGMPPHLELRVLVATDVLSEGLNLQDAACAVSYDVPWNPVRLVQRAGRIDRIGSRHRTVRVVEFSTDPALDRLLRLTERLRQKRRQMAAGAYRTPDGSEAAAGDAVGFLLTEHRRWATSVPFALGRAARLPDGLLTRTGDGRAETGTIVACYWVRWPGRAEPSFEWFERVAGGRCRAVSEITGARALAAAAGRSGLASMPEVPGWRAALDEAAGRHVRRSLGASAGGGACRPLVRRLVALLEAAQRECRGDLPRLRRLESLERRLASPLSAGVELSLRDLCGPHPTGRALDCLLPALESSLAAEGPPAPVRPPELRLLGAVLLRAGCLGEGEAADRSAATCRIRG